MLNMNQKDKVYRHNFWYWNKAKDDVALSSENSSVYGVQFGEDAPYTEMNEVCEPLIQN